MSRISVQITVKSDDPGAVVMVSEALRISRPPGIYLERYEAIADGYRTWDVEVDPDELVQHAPWVRDELGEAIRKGVR
jgi:hypothetical protein